MEEIKIAGDGEAWYANLLDLATSRTIVEPVEVSKGEGAVVLQQVQLYHGVSWQRLFMLAEVNSIAGLPQLLDRVATENPVRRGTVAMLLRNQLRAAARRRGGLWVVVDGVKRWAPAPPSFLQFTRHYEYQPWQDRDGNPV